MSLNFPLLLVIAVFVCGLLALLDLLILAPRRRAAIASYQGSVSQPDVLVVEKLNCSAEKGRVSASGARRRLAATESGIGLPYIGRGRWQHSGAGFDAKLRPEPVCRWYFQ